MGLINLVGDDFAAKAIAARGGIGYTPEHKYYGITVVDPTDPMPSDAVMTANVAGIQNAYEDALTRRVQLLLPAGHIWYNALLLSLTDPIAVLGHGWAQTVLRPAPTYSGYAIEIVDQVRDPGEDVPSVEAIDWSISKAATLLYGFGIAGNRAYTARGIRTRGQVDHLQALNVKLSYLNGTALQLGVTDGATAGKAVARESLFHMVRINNCGSDTEAYRHIGQGTGVAGDGTNQLSFVQCQDVYNYSGELIDSGPASSGKIIRRLTYTDHMRHGRGQAGWSWTDGVGAWPLMTVKGRVFEIRTQHMRTNGSPLVGGVAYPMLLIEADDTNTYYPVACKFDGSWRNSQGSGIKLAKGDYLEFSGYIDPSQITGGYDFDAPNSDSVLNQVVDNLAGTNGTRNRNLHASVASKVVSRVLGPNGSPEPYAVKTGVRTVTALAGGTTYNVADDDEMLFLNADAGNLTIVLPLASSNQRRRLEFVRVGNVNTYAVTVQVNDTGSETFNGGVTSRTLDFVGAGFAIQPNSTTQWVREWRTERSTRSRIQVKSADYTVDSGDTETLLSVDASGGARTITLLSTLPAGWWCDVGKADTSSNTVTLSGSGCTINGLATFSIATRFHSVRLVHQGAGVFVLLAYDALRSRNVAKRLTADLALTAAADTTVSDLDLTVQAGDVWVIDVQVVASTTVGAAGVTFSLSLPTGATGTGMYEGVPANISNLLRQHTTTPGTALSTAYFTASPLTGADVRARFVITCPNAGTIHLVAHANSGVTASLLAQSTSLVATRVA